MDIRARILSKLTENFTTQDLQMIDLAIAESIIGLKIVEEETLPAVQGSKHAVLLRNYLVNCDMAGLAKGSIKGYECLLRIFLIWLGDRDINTVKSGDITIFLEWFKMTRNVSNRTLENKRIILSGFFSYLFNAGEIERNPMVNVRKIKFVPKPVNPMTDEELELMREACQTIREKAIIEFLYATGCRVGELEHIKRTDIDFINRKIKVIGKGSKYRTVYLNAKAKLALQAYLASRTDENSELFVSMRRPHQGIKKNSFEKIVKQIYERTDIDKKVTPHVFRHTMATDLYERDRDIVPVQRILGHSKIETTMIYAEVSERRVQDAYRRGIV